MFAVIHADDARIEQDKSDGKGPGAGAGVEIAEASGSSRQARVSRYLKYRAQQRSLQFSDRDALQPRPTKRRRSAAGVTAAAGDSASDMAGSSVDLSPGNNWQMTNGLLASPVGRRLFASQQNPSKPASPVLEWRQSPKASSSRARKGRGSARKGGRGTPGTPRAAPKPRRRNGGVPAADTAADMQALINAPVPDPLAFFDESDKSDDDEKPGPAAESARQGRGSRRGKGYSNGKASGASASRRGVKRRARGGATSSAAAVDGSRSAAESSDGKPTQPLPPESSARDIALHPRAAEELLRKAVAMQILDLGYRGAYKRPLHVLTDIVKEYISWIGREMRVATQGIALEEGAHLYELTRMQNFENWKPGVLFERNGFTTHIQRDTPGNTTGETSVETSWEQSAARDASVDAALPNVPPSLADSGVFAASGTAGENGLALVHWRNSIDTIKGVYEDIRHSIVPNCLSRIGLSEDDLLEFLRVGENPASRDATGGF